jgi:hypothetical protein
MAQKNGKKKKKESPKKSAKPEKNGRVASVLKKALKVMGKRVVPAKKAAPKGAKKVVPAKVAKRATKKPATPTVKSSTTHGNGKKKDLNHKAGKSLAGPKVKASKSPVPVPAKGKKGNTEVVLEVPAPKGVALLGREGKKKSKSEAQALAAKRRCREPGCEHDHTLSGYCRLHYIKNWRKIKRKEAILASGQLNNYVEELVNKYPDRYLDVIRQDLASEKDWVKVVVDLELESADEETVAEEDLDVAAEGVRANRDFDDDTESF